MVIDSKVSFLNKAEKLLATEITAAARDRVLSIISDIMQGFSVVETACSDAIDDDLVECYFDAMSVRGLSKKTFRVYRCHIKELLDYLKVPIRSIMVYHLRGFLAYKKSNGMAESTLAHRRSVYSSFFTWLHREGLIEKNPVSNLATIKVPKKQKELYSDIDIMKLKDGCTSIRDKAIIYFLESSMCRISELVELDRDDIDFENREFILHGKGDKERIAFIDKLTAAILRDYLSTRTDACPALFVNRYGNRLTTDGIRFMLNNIAARAGVEHVHPHKFRRTSATNNARKGMQVQHIQYLLGHENIDTTMQYVQVIGEDAKMRFKQLVG